MDTMSSGYGEKLKELRKAEGLTQGGFSELIGIGLSTIKNYETGQKEVGLAVIDKIIKHPQFTKYALWLMTGNTAPESGQISPALSPDGQENISKNQNGLKAG